MDTHHLIANSMKFYCILILLFLPAIFFSQSTRSFVIPYGSSMNYYVQALGKEAPVSSPGAVVVYYDSIQKIYGLRNNVSKGYRLHGKYLVITNDRDTIEKGQYNLGLPVGIFIYRDRFNKRVESIIKFNNGGNIIERKYYQFDESHKKLLLVRVIKDPGNKQGWQPKNPHTWIYDSTEKHLLVEEVPVNDYHKSIQTYYPGGKLHEIFFMNYADQYDKETRLGRYEEFYQDGTKKTMGQYNFIHEPCGVWIYFDKKGGIRSKDFSNRQE